MPSAPAFSAPVSGGQVPAPADAATIAQRATVPVLTYHQVRNWHPYDSRSDRTIITPVAVFSRQMELLASRGFQPITNDQYYDHLVNAAPLPPQPVMITFDDGSESQLTNALPVLRRYGFPATFFLVTGFFDTPYWLRSAQVPELRAAGMTISSHTHTHDRVDRYRGQDWQRQLVTPRETLTQLAAQPVADFAYPYGLWKRQSLPNVRTAGYRMAFGLDTPVDVADPLRSLPRVIASPTWNDAQMLRAMEQAPYPRPGTGANA